VVLENAVVWSRADHCEKRVFVHFTAETKHLVAVILIRLYQICFFPNLAGARAGFVTLLKCQGLAHSETLFSNYHCSRDVSSTLIASTSMSTLGSSRSVNR